MTHTQEANTSRHFVLLTGTANDRRKARSARLSANGGDTENGRHTSVILDERGIGGSFDVDGGYVRVRDAGELARVREPTTGRYVRRAGQSSGPLEASPKFFTLHLDGSGCLREGEPPVSAEAVSDGQGRGLGTTRDERTQRRTPESQRRTKANARSENKAANISKTSLPILDRHSVISPAFTRGYDEPIDSHTRPHSVQPLPQTRSEKHRIEFLLSDEVEPLRPSSRSPSIESRQFCSSPSPIDQHHQSHYMHDQQPGRGNYNHSYARYGYAPGTFDLLHAEASTVPTSPTPSSASISTTSYTATSYTEYNGASIGGVKDESYRSQLHRGTGHHRSKSLSLAPTHPDVVHRPSSTSGHHTHRPPKRPQADYQY